MQWCFSVDEEEFGKCKKFAESSSPTQREYRSGGTEFRSVSKIAGDTMRGKVGEIIAKKFLEQEPLAIGDISLDFEVYPRGKWDETDIEVGGKKVSIKSSKHFSRFLLLETKDLDRDESDFYVLVLVDSDAKSGCVKGFISRDEIMKVGDGTLDLKKGQNIPGTSTPLDADNRARRLEHLHNSEQEWIEMVKKIT